MYSHHCYVTFIFMDFLYVSLSKHFLSSFLKELGDVMDVKSLGKSFQMERERER